jgi:hypothetical protein
MNGYICFYKSQRIEVWADTTFKAQLKAQSLLKVPDRYRYKISVTLAEMPNGVTVEHRAVN